MCRSSFYYEAAPENELDLALMRLIDQEYLRSPFYGSRRMTVVLQGQGYEVNRKRVQRLMREMALEAIYPKPSLSQPGEQELRFPYLMKSAVVDKPNKAWCADITYIPLKDGFGYCVAVLDWWSRYVLSWRVSNSLDVNFCLEALEEALTMGIPEIFNTDQGCQFTSTVFVERLLSADVKISWDGRGRALDNVFVERLWRSLKYEEVYLKDYSGLVEARKSIGEYFDYYNNKRPHQALRYQTPLSIYYSWVKLGALPPDPRENAQAAVRLPLGS